MRVEWLLSAERGRERQLAYIAERSPQAAIATGDAIEKAVVMLIDHPAMGRPGRVIGTRELVVVGIPCIVVYRIEPNVVVILRLLHGAQDWPRDL